MIIRKRRDGSWENKICVGYNRTGKEVNKKFLYATKEEAKNMGKIGAKIIIYFSENNFMQTNF